MKFICLDLSSFHQWLPILGNIQQVNHMSPACCENHSEVLTITYFIIIISNLHEGTNNFPDSIKNVCIWGRVAKKPEDKIKRRGSPINKKSQVRKCLTTKTRVSLCVLKDIWLFFFFFQFERARERSGKIIHQSTPQMASVGPDWRGYPAWVAVAQNTWAIFCCCSQSYYQGDDGDHSSWQMA